jgi:uncharacterized membrane protein
MPGIEITPLTATILLLLFAVALGTLVMNWGGFQLSEEALEETVGQAAICDPLTALKMRYVNNEITDEQYRMMKQNLEEDG